MELFKLLGRIVVENSEANARIDETATLFNEAGGCADDAEKKVSKLGSVLGNGFKAAAAVCVTAIGAAIAGIAKLTSAAVANYAEHEQLIGGVETLFGAGGMSISEYAASVGKGVAEVEQEYNSLMSAQHTVIRNASNAFQTAGLSADEYLSTVTSFSASLLQGLGGDTEAAAQIADQAITDMSDNANKMGTDMSLIQNAYQGFAKQNYTMLDNLKLGYGGTASEMARLINDSGVLGDTMTVTAETVNEVSFDKIIEAIHVVQDEMGITGTTAAEASGTISGSISSMKAAWQNFLTGMANPNADFNALIGNLVDSVVTVGDNIIPVIVNTVPLLVEGISQVAVSLVGYLPQILQGDLLPGLIRGVSSLLSSLIRVLPSLMSALNRVIPMAVSAILVMLPDLLTAGIQILVTLCMGITESLPELIPVAVDAVLLMVDTLTDPDNLSLLIDAAIALILALASGLISAVPRLIAKAPEIVQNLVNAVVENAPKLLDAAVELIVMLGQGIIDMFPDLIESGKKIVESIKQGISDAWAGITEWFNGLWDRLFGGRSVDVDVNGNVSDGGGNDSDEPNYRGTGRAQAYATGLDFVPYDEFPARLHRGEMVLPATQADYLRSGALAASNEQVIYVLDQILDAIKNQELSASINDRVFARMTRKAVT